MKKLWLSMAAVGLLWGWPAYAQSTDAEPTDELPVRIVELQTGSADDASTEFIELFNWSDEIVDASVFKLQYLAASGSDWLTKTTLTGDFQPRGRYLVATSTTNFDADVVSGLGLAKAGGHIRLVTVDEAGGIQEVDRISWGTAESALVMPALAPEPGQSLKRLLNEDGQHQDSDDDSQDFIVSLTPSPASTPAPTPAVTDTSVQDPTDTST
jgi:hypothetical protein